MAQISENSGGGKRSLNADLNLVPFIDLLSVCICFLLMAAVWLQIGSVQVKQALGEDAPTPPKESFELSVKLLGENQVTLELKKGRKSAGVVKVDAVSKDDLMTKFGAEVDSTLAQAKSGQQEIHISAATVVPHDKAPYSSMIAVMDVLRKREIVNLAVMPRM